MKQNDLTNYEWISEQWVFLKMSLDCTSTLLLKQNKQTVKKMQQSNADAQNMWGFKETEKVNPLSNCWFVFNLQIGKLILTRFHVHITATFK